VCNIQLAEAQKRMDRLLTLQMRTSGTGAASGEIS